jgi:hypothetical protein
MTPTRPRRHLRPRSSRCQIHQQLRQARRRLNLVEINHAIASLESQ